MIRAAEPAIQRERAAIAHRLGAHTNRACRDLCERSLLAFCTKWLPRRFTLEFGEAHHRTARVIQDVMCPEAQVRKLAIAMPPEHGKTSLVAFGLPLWAVCARGEQRVCVVTRTADAARELFNDLVSALRPGEPLALTYPHAAGPRVRQNVGAADGPQPVSQGWGSDRDDPEGSGGKFAGDIDLPSGACISVVSKFRGVTGASRSVRLPTLLVLDDIELWTAPGMRGWRYEMGVESDGRERRAAIEAWIDFTLERRLIPGGACVAVGSIPGPESWLAGRCNLFNPDGWSKMTTPAELNLPPAEVTDRLTDLIRRGRKHNVQLKRFQEMTRWRAAWPAGVTREDIKTIRNRFRSSYARGRPIDASRFDSLWRADLKSPGHRGWCAVRAETPASDRFLKGGFSMLEENAREGVRAYFAIDSELEKRRWLPDSDPPLNAKAQEESRVPMVMCVLERKQEDGTTLLTMRSHHEIEPVTNPDWPAWVRLAGVAFHLGLQEAEDLRDPIARDRLAEYARNGEN